MSDIDSRLSAALVTIFRPLASVLVRSGVSVRPVIEVLKRCFVDAALTEHGTADKPASISKASRLTGLTRAEVRRLANQGDLAQMPGTVFHVPESAVLSEWSMNPNFHDDQGNPASLPIAGSDRSFEELVYAATGERDVETVLAQLEVIGCVKIIEGRLVQLEYREHAIRNDLPLVLASGLGTLADTIGKNWNRVSDARAVGAPITGLSNDPDRLDQKTAFVRSVDPGQLMSLRRMCNERVDRFAIEMDDFLTPMEVLPQQGDDSAEVTRTHRIGVGAYYFEIDAPD